MLCAELDSEPTGSSLKSGDATKKISVTAWVRFSVVDTGFGTSGQVIFAKGHVSDGVSFRVCLTRPAGGVGQVFSLATGYWDAGLPLWTWEQHKTTLYAVAGRWYHVGATYDDSDQSYHLRIYDSVTTTVTEITGTGTNAINVGDGEVTLGAFGGFGSGFLNGWLDELVVFNKNIPNIPGEIDSIRTSTCVAALPWGGVCRIVTTLSGTLTAPASRARGTGQPSFPSGSGSSSRRKSLRLMNRTEQRIAKRLGIRGKW